MENSLLKMAVGTVTVVAFLTMPPLAMAETVVPPGNSAATQYTETFPTTGGNAEVNSSIRGGRHHGGGSPEKVLGSHTTHELEAHGEEGRTIAALATEAAPISAGEAGGGSGRNAAGAGGGKQSRQSGGGGQGGRAGGNADTATGPSLEAEASSASSGLSEVLSHATGSSNGEMGIVLPLVLLLTPILALAYVWRRRERDQAAS